MDPTRFFSELKRRNIYKVAAAYAVVAWLLLQLASILFPAFEAPPWVMKMFIVGIVLGFPVTLVLAWAFDITPEGLKRTEDAPPDTSVRGRTGRKLTAVISVVAVIASALFAWQVIRRGSPARVGPQPDVSDRSIAVLPFENSIPDVETEYLCDGIPEALINSLTELQQLKVVARSTAFRYKGKQIDPKQVGRDLQVQTVLMGVIRQLGDRLNVQVDLVDASSGAQLWGQEYDRKLVDVIAVKQALVREVTDKLRLKLTGEQQQRLTRRDTSDPEAYQNYLRGRYYWNKRTSEDIRKAIEQFQQAVDKDANYALAYVGLGDCYVLLEDYAGTPASEIYPKAKALAERALQIDSSLAEAHTTLAYVCINLWLWREAGEGFRRAIQLNPNYSTAYHWYSLYLLDMGRTDEAISALKRAHELDPLSLIIGTTFSYPHFVTGDADLAASQCQKVIALDPSFPRAYEYLGLAYLKQGHFPEGIAELQKAVELSGRERRPLRDLGYAYAISGKAAEARTVLKELEERYEKREAIGQDLAAVYAGLQEKDQAFAWLEKDFQARSGPLAWIRWTPPFESLRSDPRYTDLLQRMGLKP